jgi:Divergent InlB B-repeat domain
MGAARSLPTASATPPVVSAPAAASSALRSASASHGPPEEITSGMGWEGIDYRDTCLGCVPADPQLGVGAGYVLELTNGSVRVWLVNGTEVFNETLDGLFGAGNDSLVTPQVQFDLSSLRWFIAADDLSTNRILLGASLSSDPTTSWNVEAIAPGGGLVPTDPLLAVDAVDVVVTVNDLASNGTFLGSQVWAANKSALIDGGAAAPVAVDAPDPTTEALVPATPLSDASTLYLVDDELGTGNALHLFALNGSPPGTVTLSGPSNFATVTSAPPNATQSGSTDLLGIGDGRVDSAAWRADTLWAVATGACTPGGDVQARSCLHLWEVDTATDVLKQDFTWSTGPATYDFDPALSIATRGDVALVFGESSTGSDPSIFATGQAITDPTGTLETPVPLHNGTGPYAPPVGCTAGVCPFGDDFSIASTPSTNVHFWAVGAFAPRNSTWNYWKTWINQVAAWPTVPVTFAESGLPSGTLWSVTVNGAQVSTTNASLTVAEENGSYTYTLPTSLPGGPGERYLATSSAGTFSVGTAAVQVNVVYVSQFQLSVSAGPRVGGTVYPGGNWFNSGSMVSLSALASAGYEFAAWTGSGTGSYTGTNNPATVTMGTPIVEQAEFWVSETYPVSFSEAGLPGGTNWTVTVNGVSNGSSGAPVEFNEPNGSLTYTVQSPVPGAPQTQYAATPASGSFSIAGASTSVDVTYTPQFELAAAPDAPGAGFVNPSSGWFADGTSVNLSALAAPGEQFVGWAGSGTGSYSGTSNPAPITFLAPVTEEARFAPATTYPVSYTETGLPSGASWSVTTNGVGAASSSATVVFNEPNGSYSFGAQTTFTETNGTTFAADPGFGSFLVNGAAFRLTLHFVAIDAPATAPGPLPATSGSTGIPDWMFGAVLAGLLLVVGLLAIAIRRPPDPPTAPTPTAPMPMPPWDEGN